MAGAPDGRIFVCQQNGNLRVVKDGALLPPPFVSIPVNSSGERGLLGVAFDPNFASNQFVYIYYTTQSAPIHNRISRFTANGDVAAAESETVLLDLNNLSSATNHNGGALHFGPDGKLYVAVGENANPANAQSLNNLLGKMLRINTDPLNLIPADNPFSGQTTGNNRAIWALGLRNPFTFNFQPGTGRMFINDVGQSSWEEVNDGTAGSNYGWPSCEGPCNPANPNFRDPIHFYANNASTCAITGGVFYNPVTQQFPAQYVGKYFFADYCAGWIRYIDPTNPAAASSFATGLSSPVDLQVSASGSLYYLQRGGGGQLWRIDFTASQAPVITQHPPNQTVSAGQMATFTVAASGSMPLSYQWRKNSVNISGANSPSYTTPPAMLAENGAIFDCVVSNTFGTATSNGATLTVVPNQPPTATIIAPAVGTFYSGGETINYAGNGNDPEQGVLPPSAFTWEVVFHHDTHTHPFIPPFSGVSSGSFTIPTAGETATNVWYRIHLTVTDAGGLTHSVFRDISPRISTITLSSNPAGFQLMLDGQTVTTPFSVQSVVGTERVLGAVSTQMLGGVNYNFASWSDGGATTHTISTPVTNSTYTATYIQGLQYYPLPFPVRLLDTRPGESACVSPGVPLGSNAVRTQQATGSCGGATIPSTAKAITGNATVVNFISSGPHWITLYPSDAQQPTSSNLNFIENQIVPNNFTVGLGPDGAFKIYSHAATHFVVDITGYYAPPGAGGLYYHPLPAPVRLLDTRPGEQGCDAPGAPLDNNGTRTVNAHGTCFGAMIPAAARSIAGNATVVNFISSGFHWITLYPFGIPQPTASNLNFSDNQIVPNAFVVGLSNDGKFNIYSHASTHFVIDVAGYFSDEPVDANGQGLLYYALPAPVRLLETRPGELGCDAPGIPLGDNATLIQATHRTCSGKTIPTAAQAVVGNATVVNNISSGLHWITLYPFGTAQPTASNLNFTGGQIVPNAFVVGLSNDGRFNIYSHASTHFIIDLMGYYAP
jgi:glucose/arabinose dehydrogenase